jgi:hypothetical protein
MLEDFVDMDLDDLKKIVKIGGGNLKNCYKAETLYNIIRIAAEENVPIRDPLTQQRLTENEIKDVLRKVRVKMANRPKANMVRDGSYLDRTVIEPGFAHLIFKNRLGQTRFNLGVIPLSNILFRKLQELHSKGRLTVANNTRCCRIHLVKTLDYWKSGNVERLTDRMIEEIDQLL